MRAAIKLLFLSLLTFAAVFVVRREFFSDVMPVSWEQETPQTGALVRCHCGGNRFGVHVYALGQTMAGEPTVAQPIRRGDVLVRV